MIIDNKFKIGEEVWILYENFELEMSVDRCDVISITRIPKDSRFIRYILSDNSTPMYGHQMFNDPQEAINFAKSWLETTQEEINEKCHLDTLHATENYDRIVKFIEEIEENE